MFKLKVLFLSLIFLNESENIFEKNKNLFDIFQKMT